MPESSRPRARALGFIAPGLPTGPQNAITDVAGVRVGHATLIAGEGHLVPGQGPVRTGVSVIRPHGGNLFRHKVPAAVETLNGFGKPLGFEQVRELGVLESPIALTGTLNVGRVADALIDAALRANPGIGITTSSINVVVGETNDGWLNDLQGRHVRAEHVAAALAAAEGEPGAGPGAPGPAPAEGSVGAGTGTCCFGWKGGIGTASRVLPAALGGFTLGALVQANFGARDQLTMRGVRVGQALATTGDQRPTTETDHEPGTTSPTPVRGLGSVSPEDHPHVHTPTPPHLAGGAWSVEREADDSAGAGSVMIVLATDAPLDSRQLGRAARRAAVGLARTGSPISHGSGDFVIAFSTAYTLPHDAPASQVGSRPALANEGAVLDGLFVAVAEAVEEAVLNALCAAETMVGRDGHVAEALPVEVVRRLIAGDDRVTG